LTFAQNVKLLLNSINARDVALWIFIWLMVISIIYSSVSTHRHEEDIYRRSVEYADQRHKTTTKAVIDNQTKTLQGAIQLGIERNESLFNRLKQDNDRIVGDLTKAIEKAACKCPKL
jgi:hypothetical protein